MVAGCAGWRSGFMGLWYMKRCMVRCSAGHTSVWCVLLHGVVFLQCGVAR